MTGKPFEMTAKVWRLLVASARESVPEPILS
jgi:hypothetical protein